MRAAAGDEELRRALFRFVDVRPACRTRRELGEHLAALLSEAAPRSASGRLARWLSRAPLTRFVAAGVAGLAAPRLARRFLLAGSAQDAPPALGSLWRGGGGDSLPSVSRGASSLPVARRMPCRRWGRFGARGWEPRWTCSARSR